MGCLRAVVILVQVLDVVGYGVGDEDAARVAVREVRLMLEGEIAREGFFRLSALINAAARADFAASVEDDEDGRTTSSSSEPEAGRFTTTRHSFLISRMARRVTNQRPPTFSRTRRPRRCSVIRVLAFTAPSGKAIAAALARRSGLSN